MNWNEIFQSYWDNEDASKDGIIEHLKNNYHSPLPKHNGFILNKNKNTVVHKGIEVRLQKKTFKMLNYIYENKNRVVSRDEIYENVWEDVIVDGRTIDVHARHIRKAIPEIPMKTIKKVGLIWTEN